MCAGGTRAESRFTFARVSRPGGCGGVSQSGSPERRSIRPHSVHASWRQTPCLGPISLLSPVKDVIEIEPVPRWKGLAQHGQRMTLTRYEIAAGAPDVHEHQHPQEEAWIVIEGQLGVWVNGAERVLGPGDFAIVGANMRHRVRALRASRALVVDSPARHQLPGTKH